MDAKSHKQHVIDFLDRHTDQFTNMADRIWERPEIMWEEFFASTLQADFLEEHGFNVTRDVAGMNTAFVAERGSDGPVIGLHGE